MGQFHRRGSFFCLGTSNGSWLTPYMTPLIRGKGPPKITRKVLQRTRPPNDYKASGLLLSHLPIKQPPRSSKTPAGPAHPMMWDQPRRGLADGLHQMPVSQGYKYLLIIIDTFTGWSEGFPTWTERAGEVVKKKQKKLLREIILRVGLPRSLQSDNGTSFTSKVTEWVSKVLSIT